MRRIQIQLDESAYENLRRLAFLRRRSLAATIRDLLHRELGDPAGRRRRKEWSFGDAGSSRDPYPVSEQYDRALAEAEW
ncbi:MAG TPA: hypothetical protein VFV60_06900 [bacterium]|nr:hypothetical protein [bacterium]